MDRHESIGQGQIGLEAFRMLMNDPQLFDVPKILEIPGDLKAFKDNLDLLKRLVKI